MIKAIIFDLDGTLADTMPDLQTAMNGMLTRLGYRTRTRTELVKAINNGAREFVRRSLPREVQGVDFILQSAIDIYEDEYSKCYIEKTAPYDGIEALLMDLKSMGVKISVLSNKQDAFVKDIVGKLFDKKLFSYVQGQDKLPIKPNPTVALQLAKGMGVKVSKCLFIGDSDVDIQTAKNAGMRSVGVCWGYRTQEVLEEAGADFIAKSPNDICQIVADLKNEVMKKRRGKDKEKGDTQTNENKENKNNEK